MPSPRAEVPPRAYVRCETDDLSSCLCGCGETFPASQRGGYERRFKWPACRARWHRERSRPRKANEVMWWLPR